MIERILRVAALSVLLSVSVQAQDAVVFEDVNVVPMRDESVLVGQTVVVRDGRIEWVGDGNDAEVPDDALVIAGEGRYLVPGLAEMHAHVPPADDPRYLEEVLFLYVANGVTTVRGMLGVPEHLGLRERLERGDVLGPRLFTSGPSLSGRSVATPGDARRIVLEQARAGYDFVKLHPGLTRAAFDAAVDAAREAEIDLAGHVSEDVGLARALEAGIATIDHLDGYVQYLAPAHAGPAGFFGLGLADRVRRDLIPRAAAATRAAGVYNVPTQSLIEHVVAPVPTAEELAARPEMAYVAPQTRRQWVESKRRLTESPEYSAERAMRLVEVRRELIHALHEAGAGLLLGSDAPQTFNVPGFSLHHELAAMVAAGLRPYDALRMGTASPAAFLGAGEQRGQIVAGFDADLVLVDGNPLEDIGVLARPSGVMLRGRWLDRESLDEGLAEIAERYRE